MFHVKRSREGGDVSRETKEGSVPVSGGGLPSLPPADLAFSLPFCPHPPDPLPGGKGEIFVLFCRGLAPPAPLLLNLRGAGSVGAGAPGTPATEPARHWLFSAMSVLFAPIPPAPPSRREGGDQGYFMQGASPLASPGLNPGGAGYFLTCRCFFTPIPPPPFPGGEGGDF